VIDCCYSPAVDRGVARLGTAGRHWSDTHYYLQYEGTIDIFFYFLFFIFLGSSGQQLMVTIIDDEITPLFARPEGQKMHCTDSANHRLRKCGGAAASSEKEKHMEYNFIINVNNSNYCSQPCSSSFDSLGPF
jgi:hypothetical protein